MDPKMKKSMDAIYLAFKDYIDEQPFYDIDYMEKHGYVWLTTDEFVITMIKTPEELMRKLCLDLIDNVFFSKTIPPHYTFTLTEHDKTVARQLLMEILEKIESLDEARRLEIIEYYLKEYEAQYSPEDAALLLP